MDQILNILPRFSNDLTAEKFMLRKETKKMKRNKKAITPAVVHAKIFDTIFQIHLFCCGFAQLIIEDMRIISECKQSKNRLKFQTKCRKIVNVQAFITTTCSRLKRKAKIVLESANSLNQQIVAIIIQCVRNNSF